MLEQLTRNWWVLVVRGVAGVLFGLAAFAWPGLTLVVLVALFGAYAIVDGAFAIASAFRHRRGGNHWWLLLIEGIFGLAAGVATWFMPGVTALVLVYVIATWAVVTGVTEVVAAVRLRHEIEGEWLLGLAGIASVVMGVLLFARPGPGALALIWLIGSYAIIFGVLLFGLGFRLRGLGHAAPWQQARA